MIAAATPAGGAVSTGATTTGDGPTSSRGGTPPLRLARLQDLLDSNVQGFELSEKFVVASVQLGEGERGFRGFRHDRAPEVRDGRHAAYGNKGVVLGTQPEASMAAWCKAGFSWGNGWPLGQELSKSRSVDGSRTGRDTQNRLSRECRFSRRHLRS